MNILGIEKAKSAKGSFQTFGFVSTWLTLFCLISFCLITSAGCNKDRQTVSRSGSDDEYDKDKLPPLVDPGDILKQEQDPILENQRADEEGVSSRGQDENTADNVTDFDYSKRGGKQNNTFNSDSISTATPEAQIRSQQITVSAVALLKQGNIEQAIAQFKQAIEVDPFNHEALFQLMVIFDERGQSRVQTGQVEQGYQDLIASGEFAQRLVDTRSAIILDSKNVVLIGNAFYNAACGYCRNGDKQKAIKSLEEALKYGFDKPQLLKTDPDLQPIRGMPEFDALLKRYS